MINAGLLCKLGDMKTSCVFSTKFIMAKPSWTRIDIASQLPTTAERTTVSKFTGPGARSSSRRKHSFTMQKFCGMRWSLKLQVLKLSNPSEIFYKEKGVY
jgi:hypothetical protein